MLSDRLYDDDRRMVEDGDVVKLFDESFRKLIQVARDEKYVDVKNTKESDYESKIESTVWEVSGDFNGSIFNITSAKIISPWTFLSKELFMPLKVFF